MRGFLVILPLVAVAASLGIRAPTAAQDAAPVALPITPDPSLCGVEPRTIEEIYGLVGTPRQRIGALPRS